MCIQSDFILVFFLQFFVDRFCFDFYWRLLSLFNMRALEPIPCWLLFFPLSVSMSLSPPLDCLSPSLWLVNLPLWLLPIMYTRKLFTSNEGKRNIGGGSHKTHNRGGCICYDAASQQQERRENNTWAHQIKQHSIAFSSSFRWLHADYWTSDTNVLSHQMYNTRIARWRSLCKRRK